MSIRRRMRRGLLVSAVLLLVALLATAVAWRPLIRPALYARTGEQSTVELLKGIASYLYLRIAHPLPDLAPYTPMPHTDVNPLGVNTFLEQEVEPAKVARSLDMIRDAGFRFIRQQFPWETIEISAKGDYWDHKWDVSAWAKYDRIVDMATERDLQIIARLDTPPAWARPGSAGQGIQGPPERVEDFGDFVEAVVSRYRGKVRYYQIWNEPNLYHEWGDTPVDAAAYTRLLQEAYRRAKAADPDCVIISAGLAPTLEQGPNNLNDLVYLQRMYDAGAQEYFDILGLMAYGLWTGPTDQRVDPQRTNFARPQLVRALMVQNGDAAKPIWAMEIGWNAMPADLPAAPVFGRVSREMQADFAVEAYERARREWPWMGVMNYWFFKRATDLEQDQPFYYFSLLEPDFAPWPAYEALKQYSVSAAALYPGYHQESHWALSYSGPWSAHADAEAVLGAYRRGTTGARLRFDFWGSALHLVTLAPADPATLRVTVDGQPVRAAATQVQGRPGLTLMRALSPARHTVEIEVAGQEGLALDGLLVTRADRRGTYALGAAGMLTAMVAVGWFAACRLRSRRG
jgi:hypothetical protein